MFDYLWINYWLLFTVLTVVEYIQEALILLIDVGPSMHSVLPEIQKVCSLLIQKKVILFLFCYKG